MKENNYRWISLSLFILCCLTFILPFICCENKYNCVGRINEQKVYDLRMNNDEFEYEIRSYDDRMFIRIINIINKSENVDKIFIPEYIDGIPVEEFSDFDNKTNNINRKIYFLSPVNIITTSTSFISFIEYSMNLADIKESINSKNIEYKNIQSNYKKTEYISILKPNVIYELNYDDLSYGYDYYFDTVIDYIPKDPYRAGYKFTGWYQDKECTTLFDFNNQIIEDIYKESNKDSIYNPILIYAGWEAIYE